MKKLLHLLSAIALLGLAMPVLAANIDGKWVSEREGRDGTVSKTYYEFKVNGTALTGKIITERQGTPTETEISEGKIEGEDLSFTVVRSMRGTEMKQMYKGKLSGDQITFTIEREGGFGGMRGGEAPGGGGAMGGPPGGGAGGAPRAPREIIAKRVVE